jgi:hypothetical protein
LVQVKDEELIIGFCTETGLNTIDSWKVLESAYYFCGDQMISLNGVCNKVNVFCSNNDVVNCEADLERGRLCWSKNGNRIAECDLPVQMKNKPIYLSLMLCHSNDIVDLFV